MAEKFSLKDHLFNAETLGQLAGEYAQVEGFDPDAFLATVLPGLEGRELMERLDWIADCLEAQLVRDFPTMAAQIHTALPAPLDPTLKDDDFGHFIHAVPGILAVRHGLEAHRDLALDLLHAATQRFSMEYYIRPFINRWPEQTLARLALWARDDNYHVRRLVSEGTRPRLPWAKAITLDPLVPLDFLTTLHADRARYVTRSVANHLNDISKVAPDVVLKTLKDWQAKGLQTQKELTWMRRHALRTLLKDGDAAAMVHLGYRPDPVLQDVALSFPGHVAINDTVPVTLELGAPQKTPVLVDYRMQFPRDSGTTTRKYRIKDTTLPAGQTVTLTKSHRFKGGASTFTLTPGPGLLTVFVNGQEVARQEFELT